MLAGAYPSDEFAELKPRVVWDRVTDVVEGRRDARVVAVTSGGTIPDRGLFGVFMVGEAGHARPARRRARRGDGLRAPRRDARRRHRPRREQLAGRGDRPRPGHGQPGARRPGQAAVLEGRRGRPPDRARPGDGRVRRRARGRPGAGRQGPTRRPTTRLRERHDLDERAADNLLAYLDDEREATGALPDRPADRRRALPRRAGRLAAVPPDARSAAASTRRGRWRIEARLGERLGLEVQTIWSDDGIAIRLPEGDAPLDGIEALLFPEPDELEDLVVGQVGDVGAVRQPLPRERGAGAAPAASPARGRGRRSGSSASAPPTCWRSRRATAASRSSSRPTASACRTSSTCRPCARSWPASPGARSRSTASRPSRASPFASSLLFDYVAAYMYDGDTPLAERRAGALTLDRDLLRELLGQEELRELLDPDALADLELSPPGADRRPPGDDRSTASTTCCAGSATCRRRGRRPDRGRRRRSPARGSPSWRAAPAGGPDPDRRRRPLDRDRGRRPLSRRRRASSPPVGVPEAFLAPGHAARSTGCWRAGPGPTGRS